MVEKVGVTNCVFEKLCFPESTSFYSVFSQTQLFKNQNCMLKKTENFWKIVGCFWTWQDGGLGVCFFAGFPVIVVCFWCVLVPKVLKMLVFPILGAFVGWLILVYLGLEGLGAFVFLVFVFLICVFCFCFVAGLFWVLLLVLLFCCFFLIFLSCFCFFVFVFVFFWGFKGQVRWPKGPPHLALNPS